MRNASKWSRVRNAERKQECSFDRSKITAISLGNNNKVYFYRRIRSAKLFDRWRTFLFSARSPYPRELTSEIGNLQYIFVERRREFRPRRATRDRPTAFANFHI